MTPTGSSSSSGGFDNDASNKSKHLARHAQSVETSLTSYWVKIVSGCLGSTLTAFAVTPLEVVKVRQQAQLSPPTKTTIPSVASLPSNVRLCPGGCGTFVLNNGLSECVLPKSAVPYFDAFTGQLKTMTNTSSASHNNSRPYIRHRHGGGQGTSTFGMIRHIFATEGYAGIYAGLAPTLVMGVPNTVLYFVTYEELKERMLRRISSSSSSSSNWNGIVSPELVPALSGASARLIASFATAPLELIRTRQAAQIGGGGSAVGLYAEFQTIIRAEGFFSLYKGLSPTLLRDVPFSAVYWYCIESLRNGWSTSTMSQQQSEQPIAAWQQVAQALFNGSVSGMIAAACTTPLDVVKTQRQIAETTTTTTSSSSSQLYFGETAAAAVETTVCDHQGAMVYNPNPNYHHHHHHHNNTKMRATSTLQNSYRPPIGTMDIMRTIIEKEGILGLWKGNQARMIKVAPACAIMLSSYELGKRLLEPMMV